MTEAARQPVYLFEGFRLDAQRRVLFGPDGQTISLTPRLFDSLLYFVERAGQLLTKEQLMEALWPRVVVEEHNLNKTVSELRRMLGEKPGEHRFIVTKPGHGYRFVAKVFLEPGADASSAAVPHDSPVPAPRRRWTLVVPAVGALAIALAVLALFRPAPDAVLRTTPWSVEKRGQWSPVWSGDGEAIAFTVLSTADQPALLNIRRLDEPVARSIARREGRIPAIAQWTSSGKLLFWEREGLWSVSPVGAPPVLDVPIDEHVKGRVPMRTAHITRDGSSIALVARGDDGSFGIWSATPPSAMLERYKPAPFAASGYHNAPFLRFSPDDKQLLLIWYAAGRGEEAWLLPFPPDPRNPPRRVLKDLPLDAGSAEFSWFPDNRHLVVSGGSDLDRKLYVADTRSGGFRVFADGLIDRPSNPVVSPDGTKLVFSDVERDYDIVTRDLVTGSVADFIATERVESLPSWASAGNALVYASDRSGVWEIWLHQPPQRDRPLVTPGNFTSKTLYLMAPALSKDGSMLIFNRVEAERTRALLWMSSVDGGTPQRLTNDEESTEFGGSLSPDGNWYAYMAQAPEGGPTALKRVKATGHATPETLIEDLPATGRPAPIWSPDSKWLLVPNGGMTLVSVDERTTKDLGIEESVCTFADDKPTLYCIRDTSPSENHPFVELDFDGNVVRTIASLSRAEMPAAALGPGLSLSLTPDRSSVTYSVERTTQSLFLMEGLDTVELP